MKKNNGQKPFIHDLSDVQSKNIGAETRVWQYCVILADAVIGENCNICSHCFIENDVSIGNRVTVKFFTELCDGIEIQDDVFIGPHVSFLNDRTPRSQNYLDKYEKTIVEKGASIGGKSAILPGIKIGKKSLIGAGSVVTKDVPTRALVVGNPAKIVGWLNEDGTKMQKLGETTFQDDNGKIWEASNNSLKLKK